MPIHTEIEHKNRRGYRIASCFQMLAFFIMLKSAILNYDGSSFRFYMSIISISAIILHGMVYAFSLPDYFLNWCYEKTNHIIVASVASMLLMLVVFKIAEKFTSFQEFRSSSQELIRSIIAP